MTEEPDEIPTSVEPAAMPALAEPPSQEAAGEAAGHTQKLPTEELPTQNLPPRKSSLAVTRLIQALWLGSGAFLMLTASAAFSAASNTTDAANVVGAVLTRWHYIGLFAKTLRT